jgi:hypothetical protein
MRTIFFYNNEISFRLLLNMKKHGKGMDGLKNLRGDVSSFNNVDCIFEENIEVITNCQ